jgi:purine-binding chemotaxis protein CheW
VPGLPGFWAGLVNLRGRLYPVLNLRRFLGLPGEAPAGGGQIALVLMDDMSVALWVDAVADVRQVPLDEIGPPLAEAAGEPGGARFVRGVTPGLLTVLDLEALLADPRLTVQAENS